MKMAFEFPRLSKCCCCLSLKTGALLIGYFSLISSVCALIGTSWSLYRVIMFVNSKKNEPDSEHSPDEVSQLALSLYVAHAYILLVFLYYFVINFFLIVGVHVNKAKYMRHYFNAGLCLLAMALALVVVTTIFFGFLATVPLLKWCVVLFYFLIVVRSAFLDMEEQNRPKVYELRPIYNPQQAPLIA